MRGGFASLAGPAVWVVCGVLSVSACGPTGTQKLPLFADCGGENVACASALCFSVDSATSVCSRNCTADTDCPDDGLCATVPGVGGLCLPTGLGGRCKADEECPVGHKCDAAEKRCYIPVSREPCAPCTSSLQCPSGGRCVEVTETNERYCAAPCSDAGTCGDGYACESRDGASLCLPSNTLKTCNLGKGLCAPCRGDNECGVPGDVCVRNLNSNEQFCRQPLRDERRLPERLQLPRSLRLRRRPPAVRPERRHVPGLLRQHRSRAGPPPVRPRALVRRRPARVRARDRRQPVRPLRRRRLVRVDGPLPREQVHGLSLPRREILRDAV